MAFRPDLALSLVESVKLVGNPVIRIHPGIEMIAVLHSNHIGDALH